MATSRLEAGVIVTIVLALIGGALWLGNMQGTINSLDKDSIQIERNEAIASVKAAQSSMTEDLNGISKLLPVGSIIPSMLSADKFYSLVSGEWMLADGSKIKSSSEYAEYVGSLSVPNLQNMFLRGASKQRTVGKYENDSTKLPNNAFTGGTTSDGVHTHPYGANRGADQIKAGPYTNMSTAITIPSSGQHNHSLKLSGGGDSETRPKNIAVNFFIKINK